MRELLGIILGIPATPEQHERTLNGLLAGATGAEAADRLRSGAQHNTEKAGALLAAQGVFAVADTFALDHGWPQTPILISLVSLLVASFLVMSILRSTVLMYRKENSDPARLIYNLVISRMVRFNIALYLSFLSILLLGVSAWVFAAQT